MLTVLRPRRVPKSTLPFSSANTVSSPPRPTLSPGWNLVPRWRTMMAPAVTIVPSYTFTPSRWACESRPLRVEPPPLVLDIGSALRDSGDFHHVVALAVPPPAAGAGLVLVGEAGDLGALGLADHPPGDARLGQLVGGGQHGVAIDHQHGGQRHLVPHGHAQVLDLNPFALGDPRLLPTRLHDRIHRGSTLPDPALVEHFAVGGDKNVPPVLREGRALSVSQSVPSLAAHATRPGARQSHGHPT